MAALPNPADPLALAQSLIRCRSVTPRDAGALDVVEAVLAGLGFDCTRLPFGDGAGTVDNLFAKLGSGRPHLVFAGHTDVVPAGDDAAWSVPAFDGALADGQLWGRGAADMKGALATFIAAAAHYLRDHDGTVPGALSLLITGDEEGDAVNGTAKLVTWLRDRGEQMDHCLLGEPTGAAEIGDTIKIGRRGSLTSRITVTGRQGHVAYPDRADNPIHRLLPVLARLAAAELDQGSADFPPSSLQITSVDVANPASNVIPGRVAAVLNIRFNDNHRADNLIRWLEDELKAVGEGVAVDHQISGEAFSTPSGPFTELVCAAIQSVTGHLPAASTAGGISDARFIKDLCPVVEFGLVGETMHQIDERIPVSDLYALTTIYHTILERYYESFS